MSEWIPVSERLPDNMDEVLVWERYSTLPFVGYYDGHNWNVSEEHYDIGGSWANGYVIGKISQGLVTHWQPLPEPPKG